MGGQPLVSGRIFESAGPRRGNGARRRLIPRGSGLLSLICAAVLLACTLNPGAARAQDPVITMDNEFLNDTRLTSGLLVGGPPEVARDMAIIGGAMFDAANAASGLTYTPVAYSGPAVSGVSVDAAALAAGYTALQGIFANAIWAEPPPAGSAVAQTTVLNEINATYNNALSGLGITNIATQCASPAGGLVSVCGGIALGTTAGNANLTARGYTVGDNTALATDGSSTAILNGISDPYKPANTNAGTYIPPANRPAMFPQWSIVAPAGLSSATMNALISTVPGPPPLTSTVYAQNLLETACQGAGSPLGVNLQAACNAAGLGPETTAQAKAALFWNDPGTTFQPPGHWLDITDTLAQQQGLSTLQTARLVSLVGQAEHDAGLGAWTVKYQDLLWRPVTAIRDCSSWSANWSQLFPGAVPACDPNWTSLIATPPHPDYLAGHPAFSGAAATILENFLGTNNITFSSTSDAYCNGGNTFRSSPTGPIIACTVVPGSNSGQEFLVNGEPGFYGPASACTQVGGTLVGDPIHPTGCLIDGTTYLFSPNEAADGCSDIVNPGGANDSPLICPITETFDTISDASQGPNGAEFSRVVGGIHTPFAVEDALALGNAIGQELASENNIPEPGVLGLLLVPFGLLAGLRGRPRPGGAA
jgi:hypothetical protein